MGISHRAQTRFREYVKIDNQWFGVTYQALPAPLENYELVTSPEHHKYLDKIACPVKEERNDCLL